MEVSAIYVFGSSVEGFSLPDSDFDIGVLMSKRINGINKNKLYNRLYEFFTELLPGKNLDIIFLNTASLELKFDVVSHGKVIFEAESQARLKFEDHTVLQYADFHPLLKQFNRALLHRI